MIKANQLTANDVGPYHFMLSCDMGKKWTPPFESRNLYKIPLKDCIFETPYVSPFYHKATESLLGIGFTHFLRDAGFNREGETGNLSGTYKMEYYLRGMNPSGVLAMWNWDDHDFHPWEKADLGDSAHIRLYPIQMHECEDGTLLVPYYSASPPYKVGTVKVKFDGKTFNVTDIGEAIGQDRPQGICEPSIVEFHGRYFMTIRSQYGLPENHDGKMYHAVSLNGLGWTEVEPWRWDDGKTVETEQTQQHWLKHKNELYLVYTRKSELSNGVFRSRAPLWIAKVDTDSLRLVRDSEKIVFPENGARMGNFATANVSDDEAWIVTGEWLQQDIPGYEKGEPFYFDFDGNNGVGSRFNRIQYIGDLLLARIIFQ